MRSQLLGLVLIVTLMGCETTYYWHRANTSNEQQNKDHYECWNQGTIATNQVAVFNPYMAIIQRENIYKNCMMARGYTESDTQGAASETSKPPWAEIDRNLNSYLGKDRDSMVMQKGPPESCFTLKNGGETCVWTKRGIERIAKYIFIFDPNGKCIAWVYHAEAGGKVLDRTSVDARQEPIDKTLKP